FHARPRLRVNGGTPGVGTRKQEGRHPRDAALRACGNGAGDGNRTHASSLGSCSSTIELRPRGGQSMPATATGATRAGRRAPRFGQNRPPTVRKKLASLPPFWPTVRLLPAVTSRPNALLCTPNAMVA